MGAVVCEMCYVGVKLPKLGKVPRLFEQHGVLLSVTGFMKAFALGS